jgi:hypothetical protein
MTKQIEVYPCNIGSTEDDQLTATKILKNDKNYLVRYIRHEATVGLAKVPVRNQDGAIIEDVSWVRKRVICSGIPYGCVIAFVHREELLIGWSKRIESRRLIETRDLHSLFIDVLNDTKNVTKNSSDYQVTFDIFAKKLVNFLACQQPEESEISFSKTGGKVAAIIRGLYDTISINGNYISSTASNPVPNDIAKNLPWFIDYAETIYGSKAANVGYPDLEVKSLVASNGNSLTAV